MCENRLSGPWSVSGRILNRSAMGVIEAPLLRLVTQFLRAVSRLSLCLRFGAKMACVYRTAHSPPMLCSGLEMAIGQAEHAVLMFLLDASISHDMYSARPVRLGFREIGALLTLASHGSPAKGVFEILQCRGFDFKALEEKKWNLAGQHHGTTSIADLMLSCAQKSGSSDLLRYAVKDLGLVSSAERMESVKDFADKGCVEAYDDGVPPARADLTKYKCAACGIVGATKLCG